MNRKDERPLIRADDEISWKKILEKSETHLVIVDCHQEWCGYCEAMQPILQKCFHDYLDSDDRY